MILSASIVSAQSDFDLGKALANINTKKDLPVSIEMRLFVPSMDAHVKSDNVNLNGGMVGLKSDLNVDSNHAPELICRYKNFTADYIHLHETGGSNFDGALRFGGENYFGNVNAHSDIHYLKLNVDNEIISLMGTGADWNYGLTGIAWKGRVDDSERRSAVIPTVGLNLHMAIMRKMKFYLQASGMEMGGYGHLLDFESGLRYSPSKHFTWTLGVRSIDVNVKCHDARGDLRLNGPFFGLRSDF